MARLSSMTTRLDRRDDDRIGVAAIVELIIVICMMAWEALGREKRAAAPAPVSTAPARQEAGPPEARNGAERAAGWSRYPGS
jgi:hypothetical protein